MCNCHTVIQEPRIPLHGTVLYTNGKIPLQYEKDHYDIGFLASESFYVEKELSKGYKIEKEGEYKKIYTVAMFNQHNKRSKKK